MILENEMYVVENRLSGMTRIYFVSLTVFTKINSFSPFTYPIRQTGQLAQEYLYYSNTLPLNGMAISKKRSANLVEDCEVKNITSVLWM